MIAHQEKKTRKEIKYKTRNRTSNGISDSYGESRGGN